MPVYPTTQILTFTANNSGATFTSVSSVANAPQMGTVEDENDDGLIAYSGGGDPGNDGYTTGGNTVDFGGYTTNINGDEYAIFQSGGSYFIPHNGELSPADISDPLPVTFNISAVAVQNCFLTGTMIRCVDGERAVEALRPGDRILTAEGDEVAVNWVGRQRIFTRFGAADRLMPVRVAAGALGGGLPRRDLTLTADHALLVDGMLVNAGALVNGTSIAFVPLAEFGGGYTVYNIETEAHRVILAEGVPAESYIDYTARRTFDNYDEYVTLYREDRTIAEMDLPRITSARMLPVALKARLGAAAAA